MFAIASHNDAAPITITRGLTHQQAAPNSANGLSELRPVFRTVSLLTLCGHFPSHIFKCLLRRLVADTGMPALAVVEDLDVFEDCCLGLGVGSEPLAVDQLLFQ
jgi:hypothetical protein